MGLVYYYQLTAGEGALVQNTNNNKKSARGNSQLVIRGTYAADGLLPTSDDDFVIHYVSSLVSSIPAYS